MLQVDRLGRLHKLSGIHSRPNDCSPCLSEPHKYPILSALSALTKSRVYFGSAACNILRRKDHAYDVAILQYENGN